MAVSGPAHPGLPGAVEADMRAVVTCENCGYRETVARSIRAAQSFYVVCHRCEGVLRVEVTDADLQAAQARARPMESSSRV